MKEMLSVTEYANLTGRDPGNIRRMLAAGRLEGSKIGNQWVIPYGAEYPDDKRKKTGKYRNWRKRIRLNNNKELMSEINSLISDLTDIYGALLKKAIVYGSYARGDQTEESDIDIALILGGKPSREMTDRMISRTAQGELATGKVLSVIDIEEEKYSYWKDAVPFYRNIDREGIVIWQEV